MLGLIKLLAFIATVALLSHSTKASHCEIGQRTRCDGPKFRLRVLHTGHMRDYILIGKPMWKELKKE